MRATLDPLVTKLQDKAGGTSPALRGAAELLLAGEVGGVVGLMGRRVLGQYELSLLDEDARSHWQDRLRRLSVDGLASQRVIALLDNLRAF